MFRTLAAAALACLVAACAAPADPADRARVNAQKQEDLTDMLRKGQRN